MKRVVQCGQSRKAILGTAGAVVSLLAPQALGVVTFEFRDAAGSPADGNPNGTEVFAGDAFSFDVLVHATGGEQVLGVTFKPRFLQWVDLSSPTFTVVGEPDRTGSVFDDPGPSVSGQRLEPDTLGELGSYNTDANTFTGPNLFVARVSLQVDANMAPGSYTIGFTEEFTSWYGSDFIPLSFSGVTPYSVNVAVPEPSAVGLLGACGLLVFGLYRRLKS